MGDWNKIRAVVKKALSNGYSDEEISRGLEYVAAEGRFALTADTLRIAINRTAPRPQLRVVGGHTPYRNPTDYGDNPDPWS
jgi:phosphate-selective porin